MGHHHHHHADQFNFAYGLAVGLNLAFVIIEAFYALHANSASLLADAGHNLGDVLGLAMSWGAMLLLKRQATQKYSYGFKRTTILAALMNAIILVAATVLIVVESIHRLLHPVAVHEATVMIVAAVGIAINGGTALLFMKGQHDDLNVKGAFLHLAYDAVISLGVVITGALVLWTQKTWLDPLVGLIIAAMILWGTWSLLRNATDLILDAVPHNVDRQAVENYLKNISGVSDMHHLHIWGLSTQEVALTVHLIAPQGLSDQELHNVHLALEKEYHIHHATIQVEQGEKCQDDKTHHKH
tara:strand:+ start:90035 stop:90928 length:894 start_codon:yes stop_codon:yes gene_type:complete